MGNQTINQNYNEELAYLYKRYSQVNMMNTQQEIENINELINRYKQRLAMVCKQPNLYDKPLFEYSEIERWIEKLEKLIKKS